MRKRRHKIWERLYDGIYHFDKDRFMENASIILNDPLSRYEYEEILFKTGDTLYDIFSDGINALKYYEKYMEEFGEDGRFSKQISERIRYIKK